jgi:hypothetical protein
MYPITYAPRLSKKGTIDIVCLRHAKALIAHSSLFLAIMPKNLNVSLPTYYLGHNPNFMNPIINMRINDEYYLLLFIL